jgi:DivIVA domain-containing protein
VDLDHQVIERRDFPIVRRGYDPASVDAHLRALSADVDELQREASSRGQESLASVAGTQVQGILEAAQATAAEIERGATEEAHRVREQATEEARRTREDAIARAQAHIAAVAQAAEGLLARVGPMDSETGTLIESLRSGASRLAGDLAAVETEMRELYDAAAGRSGGGDGPQVSAAPQANVAPVAVEEGFAVRVEQGFAAAAVPAAEPEPPTYNGGAQPVAAQQPDASASFEDDEVAFEQEAEAQPVSAAGGDVDGARLVALNMALNGDSREETGRYLAENFEVGDSDRLLDEVYAAIEG